MTFGAMETDFRAKRAAGRKLLVPYITGGLAGWQDAVRAAAAAGADAIEIGIPFSDPVMDGPIIQQASQAALESGATPVSILHDARSLDVSIPLAVMTYYNTVHHAGHARFAAQLADAGIVAAIVPDLPLEEAGPWCEAADAVGLLGVTGERDVLAHTAAALARRLKAITDVPVLVGVGVSNAAQAREACEVADGVVMGASVVRRLLEGGADAVGEFVGDVRHAIEH